MCVAISCRSIILTVNAGSSSTSFHLALANRFHLFQTYTHTKADIKLSRTHMFFLNERGPGSLKLANLCCIFEHRNNMQGTLQL